MPLLGKTSHQTFEVTLSSNGLIETVEVIATDSEHAAWIALELSFTWGLELVNVRIKPEW